MQLGECVCCLPAAAGVVEGMADYGWQAGRKSLLSSVGPCPMGSVTVVMSAPAPQHIFFAIERSFSLAMSHDSRTRFGAVNRYAELLPRHGSKAGQRLNVGAGKFAVRASTRACSLYATPALADASSKNHVR